MNKKKKGFIKGLVIIILAIITLNHFNISVQEAADWFKSIFNYFLNLINF